MNINFFQQIFDKYPGLVFVKNLDSVYLHANQFMLQHLNMASIEQLIGKTDHDLVWHRFAEQYQADDKRAIEQGMLKVVERIILDGQEVTSVVKKFPLYEDSEIVAVAGITLPISDKFNSERFFLDNRKTTFLYLQETIGLLSKRESQCLFYLIRGNTAPVIAEKMHLSKRTIEQYIESMKNKLNCANKTELLEVAFRDGFHCYIPEGIVEF